MCMHIMEPPYRLKIPKIHPSINNVHGRIATNTNFETYADKQIQKDCPVNAWNEWDPLEEVIVGRPEGSILPKLTIDVRVILP